MYYLGANHRKKDLNKVIKNRLQNLNEEQQKYLLIFLQNPEQLLDGTLVTWETDPLYLESKEYS